MTDFDPDAHLEGDSSSPAFDPDAHLDSPDTHPETKPAEARKGPYDPARPAIGDTLEQGVHEMASSGYHTIVGGYKGLAKFVTDGPDAAAQAVADEQAKTYQAPVVAHQGSTPTTTRLINEAHAMPAPTAMGDLAGGAVERLGGTPAESALMNAGVNTFAPMMGVPRGLGGPPGVSPTAAVTPVAVAEEAPRLSASNLSLEQTPGRSLPTELPAATPAPLSVSSAPRAPSWEPKDANAPAPFVDSEPAKGGLGLSDTQRNQRAEILSRVGIDSARESALSGDRGNAATDYQLTKFNQEPAGKAADAQFAHEKTAMTNHATAIVEDTGGTLGTSEDEMYNRGKTIDAPFKDLRQWFKEQSKNDYATVKAQYGDKPVGQMEETQALLKDPDFTETLLAKNQGHLLTSVQRQFDRFKELNPGGFTVDNAENFRKFLNQVWTPDTSAAIGKLTNAIDSDVTKGAGADFHANARARIQLKHQLLDDPDGVSQLFDHDPKTPMNRSMPFNAIPKELTRLDPDQFQNVLKTLDQMPAELQPKAQAAKSEIKAQLANQMLEEGAKTQGQWNAPGVTKVIKANSAKIKTAFGDDPQALQKIQDLDSAGRILKVDQSYPGAAAQASSAVKRGMMSHLITRGSTSAGAMVGGAIGSLAGPPGAAAGGAIGAAAGEGLGLRAGQSMAEKAALKNWQGRVTSLDDLKAKR